MGKGASYSKVKDIFSSFYSYNFSFLEHSERRSRLFSRTLTFVSQFTSIFLLGYSSHMSSIPAAWVNEPDGRGTWGLIQTCLLTLFLCVYTAVHLNVLPHQSKKQSFFRRIRATLLACVAPEFMLVYAMYQWSLAKQLQSQLNRLGKDVSLDLRNYQSRLSLLCESGSRL